MDTKLGRTSIVIWIFFLWLGAYIEVGLPLHPHLSGIGGYAFAIAAFAPLAFLVNRLENRWRAAEISQLSRVELPTTSKPLPRKVLVATLVLAVWMAFGVAGTMWSTVFNDGRLQFVWASALVAILFFLLTRVENRWRLEKGRYLNHVDALKPPKLLPTRVLIATLVVGAWIAFEIAGMMTSPRFNEGWLQFVWIGVLLTIFSFLEIKWQKQDASETDHGSDARD